MPPFFRWHRTCAMARRALCACWPDVLQAWRRQGRKPKNMKYDADRTHSASSVIRDICLEDASVCLHRRLPPGNRLDQEVSFFCNRSVTAVGRTTPCAPVDRRARRRARSDAPYPPPLRHYSFLKNPVDRRLIPAIVPFAALVFLMFEEAPVWVGAAFLAKGHMRSGHFAMELVISVLAPGKPLTVAVLGMRGRTLFSKPVSRLFPITPRLGQ
jgi:hypothetical protein